MTAERNGNGYDIVSQNYFSELKLHLGRKREAAKRSSLCEARQKLSWKAFEFLLAEANLEKRDEKSGLWKGHRIRAIDGTSLTLPASEAILEEFPRKPGVKQPGSHYPFGRLITATNIVTGQPVGAKLGKWQTSERELALGLIRTFQTGDVALLDRGFEGFDFFKEMEKLGQFFVCRVRTRGGVRREVKEFLKTNKRHQIITLSETTGRTLKVRAIRRKKDRKGDAIVILTNLPEKFSHSDVWKLYLKRWQIETMYYRVKELFKIERFHSRNANGLLQEVFANLFLLSMVALIVHKTKLQQKMPSESLKSLNFKNAAEVVRRHLIYCVEMNPNSRSHHTIAKSMIAQVQSCFFYQQPNRKNPRISKQPCQTWHRGTKNRPRNIWEKRRLKLA